MQYFFVYILKCNDDSCYIGHTDDLQKRLSEHMNGSIPGYTSTRLPITLVFQQQFGTREEALESERKIKKWSRTKKEALINGDFETLKNSSKKIFHK